jgi:hypothetical protein
MEFKNLSSTQKAISDLNKLFGVKSSVPKKDKVSVVISYLKRSSILSKRVLKRLRSLIDDSELISEYVAVAGRFTVISEKIINKLEDNLYVKEDFKTP